MPATDNSIVNPKMSESFDSKRFGMGEGRSDRQTPALYRSVPTAATGVRNPANTRQPAPRVNNPQHHAGGVSIG